MPDDDRQKRRTNPEQLRLLRPAPRPMPGVPDRHLRPPLFHAERPTQPGPEPRIESPPPTRRQDAPPHSVAPHVDQAIGKATRAIVAKIWPILVAGVLGTGGGVVYQRTTAPPERADAVRQRLGVLERQVATERQARLDLEDYLRRLHRAARCRDEQAMAALERLTPDPDRMRAAKRPAPFVDNCPALPSAPP